jgi:hypothetical protein
VFRGRVIHFRELLEARWTKAILIPAAQQRPRRVAEFDLRAPAGFKHYSAAEEAPPAPLTGRILDRVKCFRILLAGRRHRFLRCL